jgi:hypothetical protein
MKKMMWALLGTQGFHRRDALPTPYAIDQMNI